MQQLKEKNINFQLIFVRAMNESFYIFGTDDSFNVFEELAYFCSLKGDYHGK